MFSGKWIEKIDRWGAWILFCLILLFFVTGYGMTKQIMDPALAKYIHTQILPIPLFIFFMIHVMKSLYKKLKSWQLFTNAHWLNIYLYLFVCIITALFIWLHFR